MAPGPAADDDDLRPAPQYSPFRGYGPIALQLAQLGGILPNPGVGTRRSVMPDAQGQVLQATSGRDAFISYASQDKAVADAVCEALESAGVACWIAPRDVTPGAFYAESIVHAIDSAKVIVLVLSRNAADSQHVFREVERASSKRHPVVSFRIDDAPLPAGLEYFLNTSQWLDASTGGVERALSRLVDALRSALAQPSVVVRSAPVPSAKKTASSARSGVLVASALILAAALAYFGVDKIWLAKRAVHAEPTSSFVAAAAPDKSIAVLPFVDMSERHDQEYFSDGLSEELIDQLAHSADLKVIARTSSFQFKGKNDDMRTIGRTLGVANLLEGSVRRSGNAIRITAQLISVIDGAHRWSETYDRKMSDIFKVQDEIAAKVVQALKASLALDGGQQAAAPNKADTQVMLLQARFFENRGTAEDIQRAIAYYKKATELEPTSALAWASLSIAQSKMTGYELATWRQARKSTLEYAQYALRLDPANARAHEALGRVRLFDLDWTGADGEIQKAIQIDPQLHPKEQVILMYVLGRLGEALTYSREWVVRDPLNHFSYQQLAQTLWAMGRNAEAEIAIRKAIEVSPSAIYPHSMLAMLLGTRGAAAEAFSEIAREPNEANRAIATATVYQLLGPKAEASAARANFEQKHGKDSPTIVADLYELEGDGNQAFRWLNVAYDDPENRSDLSYMKGDPFLRPLHGDPRWKSLLQKLNLPE